MGSLLRFRRSKQERSTLNGPSPEIIRVVTLDIAQQAMREVMTLAPGHRLVVERHIDDRAPFTITVERNPSEGA